MVDYRTPNYQYTSQRPMGPVLAPPLTINPHLTVQHAYGSPSPMHHQRRRTNSSGVLPGPSYEQNQNNQSGNVNRRSIAGSSMLTTASGNNGRINSVTLRRSGSNATSNSSTSTAVSAYVATLRKQKATVWCDRSQPEDPRVLAAQRAAKIRAANQVIGSSANGLLTANQHGVGSSTGSPASSIHAGRSGKLGRGNHIAKVWTGTSGSAGIGGSLVAGVPARLSATEVLGDSSDEEEQYVSGLRRRSGSGRSSLNSNHRRTTRSSTMHSDTHRNSTYGALQTRNSSSSSTTSSIAELGEDDQGKQAHTAGVINPYILEDRSSGTNSRKDNYLGSGDKEKVVRSEDRDGLKRRGSVDEREVVRTMTMSGVRLFVANPDT
ncbi:hypothetical protein RUND412_005965 [Rhizina undulata]